MPRSVYKPGEPILSTRLRRFLEEEGMTQQMLAEWTGFSPRTISSWIEGHDPGASKLRLVAKVLRRSMDEFFEEDA